MITNVLPLYHILRVNYVCVAVGTYAVEYGDFVADTFAGVRSLSEVMLVFH